MKLTSKTFKNGLTALESTYLNWTLPKESITAWKNVLASAISDELYPMVILEWVSHMTTPPKNPAEIIKYASDMVAKEYGNADTEADILINSARNAYYATEDFEAFSEMYSDSFAAMISGMSDQDAYVVNEIQKHSNNPKVLILVYDELKGEVSDCFKGDTEHGVEFLRNHIKKNWNAKSTDAARAYLMSGKSNGLLEG